MNVSKKLMVLCALAWVTEARGQQPLVDFVAASATGSVDQRLAVARLQENRARKAAAGAALLPSVTLTGGYTRNQEEVAATFPGANNTTTTAVITALDQVDAQARAELVLVDVGAWSRYLQSASIVRGSDARQLATQRDVHDAVVQAWFALATARQVLASARMAEETAVETLTFVEAQQSAGRASVLDLERARADRQRAAQQVAQAELDEALGGRRLEVLTGLVPDDSMVTFEAAQGEEKPVEAWLAMAGSAPQVDAAQADRRAATLARTAQQANLLPSVKAFANERYTNAAGFGLAWFWSAGVQATWRLDAVRPAEAAAVAHQARQADLELERAERDAATAIFEAWHRTRAFEVSARAAEGAAQAAERAATVARASLTAGSGSALELSQAERDRFAAEVAHLRAQGDQRAAQLRLRLSVGLPPDLSAGP